MFEQKSSTSLTPTMYSIAIRSITPQETYTIRQVILRPNRPLMTCFFDGDALDSTIHFGLYADGEQAGIISLFKHNNSRLADENQYQIRGMAVLDKFQKMNFGRKLVEHSEEFLKSKNIALVWFNARASAVDFYKKSGYQIIGKAFDIPDVGTHYVMWKKI